MEHPTSNVTDLVTGIVLLMLVAAVTTMISKRIDKIPLTILLVFVGITIAAGSEHMPILGTLADFKLTPELVLFVFIPTLIFESAFNLDARQVSRNIWPILILAVPGLLISTVIIGLIIAGFTDFSIMVALLLGAILSATDPVAVISIFKQLGVPERLTVLVEGESLFNDATSLVLATLLLGILVSGEFSGQVVASGLINFLFVFLGGVVVGSVLAVVVGMTLGSIESDADVEITLTTILAYFSFIIAEHVFHVSGIMAVVAAGIIIGSWGKSKISPSTSEFMEHFWEYLAFIANALIFVMVGLQIDILALWASIDLIALVVVAMLISRALVIFTFVPLLGKLPNSDPIEMPFQQVMYWGGLRGAIALAIVLSLPEFDYKETMVTVVMGAVLFTLVVQGLSIEKLVKYLKLNIMSPSDQLAKLEGDKHAREEGLARVSSLVGSELFSQRIANNLQEKCRRELTGLDAEIQSLMATMTDEDKASIVGMRCLAREKARAYELFSKGLINEWAFRELDYTLAVQLDDVRHNGKAPTASDLTSRGKSMDHFVISVLENFPGLSSIAEKMRTSRIIRDYDVAWGRYCCARSVQQAFDEILGKSGNDDNSDQILRNTYEEILSTYKSQMDEVADQFPEFVETMQEQTGQRLLLIAEHYSVEHASEHGMIHKGIAEKILKDQTERIRQLKGDNVSAAFEIEVSELLLKVPLFKGMEEDFELIGRFFIPRTVPRGRKIVRQGQVGDSMFLIARGIAHVFIQDGEHSQQVATLYSGDFFGEAALLHLAPRNATTISATPCSLYELKRADLEGMMSAFPEIRDAVMKIDKERLDSNTQTGTN
ncbi:MAG: cation:proton antiporter [Pseudomonadales bacterium]